MKLLVIVPAYNEEGNIKKLINNIVKEGHDYLVINDGSTDSTAEILDQNHFNHLDLVVNIGLAGVAQAGFRYAYNNDYNYAIVIDGDGQHPPKYINDLIKKTEEGYDYVIGSRFLQEKKPYTLRMLGSRLISLCLKLTTGQKITDPTSGMRIMGRAVLKDFSEDFNYIAEPDALAYLLKKNYRVAEIQVSMRERESGISHFGSPINSIKYMYSVLMSIIFIQLFRK